MHAALLGAPAEDGVDRLPGLEQRHHLALARDDPKKDVGAHRGGQHCADQQERGAPGEQLASQPGGEDDEGQHTGTDDQVAMLLLAEGAADRVVDEPADHQESERGGDGGAGRPVVHALVHQECAGIEQVEHHEQGKAGQPSAVAFPVEPVQVRGHLLRREQVLLRMIEAAAVHRPQLAAHALRLQRGVLRRRQAVVEEDEVEGRADPGDGHDHVRPAQQQVGPIEQVGVHRVLGVAKFSASRDVKVYTLCNSLTEHRP